MNIKIRNEQPQDYCEVESITRDAFWNLYAPGCNEHYIAHILREHNDFIKKLDFVAEVDGELAGNIMYTKALITDSTGQNNDVISFGPLSVLPKYQKNGVGSALIKYSIKKAAALGYRAVFILGSPDYYCRFGFRNSIDFEITDANGKYPYAMLALELYDDALKDITGALKFSEAFDFDYHSVEVFDKEFPAKIKETSCSQTAFNIAVRAYL